MGSEEPVLEIRYSIKAQQEVDGIWNYNAKTYASADHANAYVDFLKMEIRKLVFEPEKGRIVSTNPKFRYLTMKLSTDGHGHIAIYRITKTAIQISRVLHTSQDWQSKVVPKSK